MVALRPRQLLPLRDAGTSARRRERKPLSEHRPLADLLPRHRTDLLLCGVVLGRRARHRQRRAAEELALRARVQNVVHHCRSRLAHRAGGRRRYGR